MPEDKVENVTKNKMFLYQKSQQIDGVIEADRVIVGKHETFQILSQALSNPAHWCG